MIGPTFDWNIQYIHLNVFLKQNVAQFNLNMGPSFHQMTKLLNGLWSRQLRHFLAFTEIPAPDEYLPLSLERYTKSGNRLSLVVVGWFSIFRTHCITACGQEITQSPNPPQGWRTTTTTTGVLQQCGCRRRSGDESRNASSPLQLAHT